jgi:hypothetical protein
MVSLADLQPTHASFMYLERYVNAGSPSGFSFQNTPGPGFRACDAGDCFNLPIFDCASFSAVHVGDVPTLAAAELPVHPEMADNFASLVGQGPARHLPAAATSSGRTLAVVDRGIPFYAKVAYQRLLGRITRRMTRAHVVSAIEVSRCYEGAIAAGRMPQSFYMYREHSGLHFPDETGLKDWGYVERDIAPYPRGTFIEVPAFSLLPIPSDGSRPLLADLLDRTAALRTSEGFFDLVIRPLVDLYFSSVIVLGLQPEAHAQNVVCLLNDVYVPVGFALRDMESVDKDVPLLERCGLLSTFTPTGYKFLFKDAYNYQVMHSFMYDFKFGEYLLGPLVDTWGAYDGRLNVSEIEERTKTYVREQLALLPDDFFPAGVWYDYDAIVHEGAPTRQYREHPHPRFR